MSGHHYLPECLGQQGSFLWKCWAKATPNPSGVASGQQEQQARSTPATPDLPRAGRGRFYPENHSVSPFLPQGTGEGHKGVDVDSVGPDDMPPEWREQYEERAGIMEFDGGLSRERAEALALVDITGQMGSS